MTTQIPIGPAHPAADPQRDFDARLRGQYQLALAHVPQRTRLRLHPRDESAAAGSSMWWRRHGGWIAVSVAALSVAVLLRTPAPMQGPGASAPVSAIASANTDIDAPAVLDEDPAFLAWLGGAENDWIASQ